MKYTRYLSLSVLMIFIFASVAFSATYYVDSNAANDSGNGSINYPKKTIGAGMALLANGDTLCLKKGGFWRERVAITRSNITITSYGEGAAPIVTWATLMKPEDWTEPDVNGVYTYAWSQFGQGTQFLSENGICLPKGSGTTLPEGPGYWYASTSTVYYKPTTGTPQSQQSLECGSASQAGVFYNSAAIAGLVVDGIHFRYQGVNSWYKISSATFQNCQFEQMAYQGIYILNRGFCLPAPSFQILNNTFTACANNLYLTSENRKIWWLNGIIGGTIQEPKKIEQMSNSNPCTVTITNHGLSTGTQVSFQGISQTNWTNLNYNVTPSFTITVTGPNTFTLNGVDTSTCAAYNSVIDQGTAINGYMQGSMQGVVICGNVITKSNLLLDGKTPWSNSGTGDIDGMSLQCLKDSIIENNDISGKCVSTTGSGAISYWTTDSDPPTADTTGNIIRNNYIHDVEGDGIIHAGAFYPEMSGNIYNNIIVNFGNRGINLNRVQSTSGSKIYNNTIVNGPLGILINTMGDYYHLRNNIIKDCTTPIKFANSTKLNNTMDYNCIYPATNFYYNGSKTLAQWQSCGLDVHSIASDPKFVGSGSSVGRYRLQSSSPCKYSGIPVGLTHDYFGNSWANPPSIGAIQFYSIGGTISPWKVGGSNYRPQ